MSIFGFYQLIDESHSTAIKTWDNTFGGYPDISNNCTNVWGTQYQRATSAHWATEKAYDYFRVFGRSTLSDNKTILDVVAINTFGANVGKYQQAGEQLGIFYHNNPVIKVRNADNGQFNGTLDIVGHEVTHGIMYRNGNAEPTPNTTGEAGAINEAFADIFGICIEKFTGTETFDWLWGENAKTQRNFASPATNVLPGPSIYGGTNWQNPNVTPTQGNDYGGIHTNMTVGTHWFYQLSAGTPTTLIPALQGIGVEKASYIAYRAMTIHALSAWTYPQMRQGTIQAAIDIYGLCSNEVRQVRNAWKVVGVGGVDGNADNAIPCVQIIENNFIDCLVDGSTQFIFTPKSNPLGLPITWTVSNSQWTGVNPNVNVLTIGNTKFKNGNVIAKLTATPTALAVRNITYANCGSCPPPCPQRILPTYKAEDKQNENRVEIYPNPTMNKFNIVCHDLNGSKVLILFNLQGQKVLEQTVTSTLTEVEVSGLPDGVYILQISDNNIVSTHKLLIQR